MLDTAMGTVAAYVGLEPSERAELEWLLESGALGRSANLTKVLRYVCEETAAGRADAIKEYSIAVEALGRKSDFDPQYDTIVRVTVHTLRKRLQELYETGEGASHAVRVVIPAGGYGAQFLHIHEDGPSDNATGAQQFEPEAIQPPSAPGVSLVSSSGGKRVFWASVVATLVVLCIAGFSWRGLRSEPSRAAALHPGNAPTVVSGPARILLGQGRNSYTDRSGNVWEPRPVCEGGENVRSTGADVAGTEDPAIYNGGLRGFVRCTFHARPGFYELHFFFAEPTVLEPAERVVNISVNSLPYPPLDVVDRAGGDHRATSFTVSGVSPENDGTIHLDFMSEVSPVNAIELLPAPSAQPLPVRLIAAAAPFKDEQGNLWLSDRFFRGGRHAQPPDREHQPSLGLYASGRIGSFQYAIPEPPGIKYKVKLYFREAWFGQATGAPGGPGSRVFDVYCNGAAVLQHFDILAQGHGNTVVKTIDGVTPTPQGLLNLEFVQVANYPMVNAIEVVPEPSPTKL